MCYLGDVYFRTINQVSERSSDYKLEYHRFQRTYIVLCLIALQPITIFFDFKSAFDMLWHNGCIGKFRQMVIPIYFTNWIKAWLENRRGYIDYNKTEYLWSAGAPRPALLILKLMGIKLNGQMALNTSDT